MIIELCGMPGAGKSSIARELVTQLRAEGRVASLPLEEVSPRQPRLRRLRRKVQSATVEVLRHPSASIRTVGAVVRSGQPTMRDVAIRSLNWLVLRSTLRRARTTAGVNILDQGIIQELASLGYSGDAEPVIAIADPGAGRLAPDLILVVDVEPGLADERLAARPGSESRVEAEGVDRPRELERQGMLVETSLLSWMERFGGQVPTTVRRTVNGRGPIDTGQLAASLPQHEKQYEVGKP